MGAAAIGERLFSRGGTDEGAAGDVLGAEQQVEAGADVVGIGSAHAERIGGVCTGKCRWFISGLRVIHRSRIWSFIVIRVKQDRLPDLPQIAGALDSVGRFTGSVQAGQQDRDQLVRVRDVSRWSPSGLNRRFVDN